VKKSSKLLLFDDDFEAFDVIGICSGMNDYRIAWNLNKAFSWQLEHSDRVLEIPQKKSKEVLTFSYYKQLGFEEFTDLYLVKNKQLSRPLLEDYPQLDYILIIKNNLVFDVDELVQLLRQHQQIIAAYRYDSSAFSISEYLQFEEPYE
jgi:hypothetical protein